MPIYDYRCNQCGMMSEILVRVSHDEAVRCPDCGSEDVERLISASFMIKTDAPAPGATCCGRTERCETPPCSTGGSCRRE